MALTGVLVASRLALAEQSSDTTTREFAQAVTLGTSDSGDQAAPSGPGGPASLSRRVALSTMIHGTWGWKGSWWDPTRDRTSINSLPRGSDRISTPTADRSRGAVRTGRSTSCRPQDWLHLTYPAAYTGVCLPNGASAWFPQQPEAIVIVTTPRDHGHRSRPRCPCDCRLGRILRFDGNPSTETAAHFYSHCYHKTGNGEGERRRHR